MDHNFQLYYERFKVKLSRENASYDELYGILAGMKNRGLDKEFAYSVLEKLRESAANEVQDDLVLDLMDIAVNYCSPHVRIWDL